MNYFKNILYVLFIFSLSFKAFSQSAIQLSINKDQTYSQKKIISNLLKIQNSAPNAFEGYIALNLPKELRSISGDTIKVFADSKDSSFVPLRFIETGFLPAGRLQYTIKLLDENKRLVKQMNSSIYIEESNNIRLNTDKQSIFITNSRDSVHVKTSVNNYGNKNESVTLLYRLTDRDGNRYFVEQKKLVPMRTEVEFSYSFLPNRYQLEQQSTVIQITALRGNPQTIFDNTSITLVSVSSDRRYNLPQSFEHMGFSSQSATLMYRKIGDVTNVFQFIGQGDLNLPVGNLNLKANILQSNSQKELMVTNTALMYQLNSSEFLVGNINEVLEHSIFGRGLSVNLQNSDKSKGLKIGLVDPNFNLLSSTPFFQNGYSTYAIASWGKPNDLDFFKTNLLFRKDPFENANHTIAGIDRNRYINKNWSLRYQIHGAYSSFENISKPTFSSSLMYSGKINKTQLSGNFYAASDYFPGNRRGNRQFQQSINRAFENGSSIWINGFLMNVNPKYINIPTSFETNNILTNTGFSLPKFLNSTISFAYNFQNEKSNAYNLFIENIDKKNQLASEAHRGSFMFNWHSQNLKNLVSIITDYGKIKYSSVDKAQNQVKTNISYSYKIFNISTTYQKGAYYLSEYISSLNYKSEFSRLSTSLYINQNGFNNKLNLNLGVTYINDKLIGTTPSATFNLRFVPNRAYVFFANSSWYQYKFNEFPTQSILNIETGITRNFNDKAVITKKKGRLEAFVYLDKNANDVYDGDDIPANNFFVDVDQNSFITDRNGKFTFSYLPYNTYEIKPVKENGWFYEGQKIGITKLSQKISIPLRQMGSISGLIKYNYDPQLSLEFEPKSNNINFIISKNNKQVLRLSTDAQGRFLEFLPTGEYQIELEVASLPENTYTSSTLKTFSIISGEMTHLSPFEIEVKSKKINIKRFGEQ